MSQANPILVEVRRGEMVESVHRGAVLAIAFDGQEVMAIGDVDRRIYPRSSLKPLQCAGMVRAGLSLDEAGLAIASASHSGERIHLDEVRRILAAVGLSEEDLQNTPALPLNAVAQQAWLRAGGAESSLTQNCSGKHAAMLATCRQKGWPLATYREFDHPLQLAIRDAIEDLCGERIGEVAVDGCGAPVFALTFRGIARGYLALMSAEVGSAEGAVADAMRARPELVAGEERTDTKLMRLVPGLISKGGAEGVVAMALPDGPVVVLKVDDGAGRAASVLAPAALRAVGVDVAGLADLATEPVLGHGEAVGAVIVTGLVTGLGS